MKWELVASAPMYGDVLVYHPDEEGLLVAYRTSRGWWSSETESPIQAPTHWMPLPESPT